MVWNATGKPGPVSGDPSLPRAHFPCVSHFRRKRTPLSYPYLCAPVTVFPRKSVIIRAILFYPVFFTWKLINHIKLSL